jgi:hypothetical protein
VTERLAESIVGRAHAIDERSQDRQGTRVSASASGP